MLTQSATIQKKKERSEKKAKKNVGSSRYVPNVILKNRTNLHMYLCTYIRHTF